MSPQHILLQPNHLYLNWDGQAKQIGADVLRQSCLCADCRVAVRQAGRVPAAKGVLLSNCEVLGHYALRLCFSDGHERGIYPWLYLQQLATDSHCELELA